MINRVQPTSFFATHSIAEIVLYVDAASLICNLEIQQKLLFNWWKWNESLFILWNWSGSLVAHLVDWFHWLILATGTQLVLLLVNKPIPGKWRKTLLDHGLGFEPANLWLVELHTSKLKVTGSNPSHSHVEFFSSCLAWAHSLGV